MLIPVDKILPNPEQPRMKIDPGELDDLAISLKLHGLINPICVEAAGDQYILVDGERRWRAAKLAGWTEIEATIRPGLNGSGQMERTILAMTANIQRSDLNPIEEALTYKKLVALGMSGKEIAAAVGRVCSTVSNRMRMLNLAAPVQALYKQRKLPMDEGLLNEFYKLDVDTQVYVAQIGAKNKLAAKQIIGLCKRIGKRKSVRSRDNKGHFLEFQKQMQAQVPALQYVTISSDKMFATWHNIREATVYTCHECPLFEDYKEAVCKSCPMTIFLVRLAREGNNE